MKLLKVLSIVIACFAFSCSGGDGVFRPDFGKLGIEKVVINGVSFDVDAETCKLNLEGVSNVVLRDSTVEKLSTTVKYDYACLKWRVDTPTGEVECGNNETKVVVRSIKKTDDEGLLINITRDGSREKVIYMFVFEK